MSRYFDVEASEGELEELTEYRSVSPGMAVTYLGDVPLWDELLIVDELIRFNDGGPLGVGSHVVAILNDGGWEVNADNLAVACQMLIAVGWPNGMEWRPCGRSLAAHEGRLKCARGHFADEPTDKMKQEYLSHEA